MKKSNKISRESTRVHLIERGRDPNHYKLVNINLLLNCFGVEQHPSLFIVNYFAFAMRNTSTLQKYTLSCPLNDNGLRVESLTHLRITQAAPNGITKMKCSYDPAGSF